MRTTKQMEAELERRRCKCCITERQLRAAVWFLFGAALLAYTIYTVVQTVNSRTHPATTQQVLAVDEVLSPGIIMCPFDSYEEMARPQHFVQEFVPLEHTCQIIGTNFNGPNVYCPARYIDFAFRTVTTVRRVCLDIKPNNVLRSTRDLVSIRYYIGQQLTDGRGSEFNGLYYGFYAEDTDESRNASVINLANAGGKTVISFTATEYQPLGGDLRIGFDVGSVASAGLLSDGITDDNSTGIPTRYFGGSVYLATAQMNKVLTTEIWGFDWSQALGAIGGIYSLLKGWVITLQGEPKDPEGMLKRYFYSTPKAAATAAAPTSSAPASPAAARDSDMELRQRGTVAAP